MTRGGPRGRDERPRDNGRARPPLLTYAVWLTYAVAGVLEVVGGSGSGGEVELGEEVREEEARPLGSLQKRETVFW